MRDAMVLMMLLAACGCFPQRTAVPDEPKVREGWPKDWAAAVGQTVTVDGTAGNAKLGALLEGKDGIVWIDGHDAWPDGMHGKRVRVTGKVIVKDDLPVVVTKPGDPPSAGVAGPKRRYLLADATWKVME